MLCTNLLLRSQYLSYYQMLFERYNATFMVNAMSNQAAMFDEFLSEDAHYGFVRC